MRTNRYARKNFALYYVIIGVLLIAIAISVFRDKKPGNFGTIQKVDLPEAYYITLDINDTFVVIEEAEEDNGYYVTFTNNPEYDFDTAAISKNVVPGDLLTIYFPKNAYDYYIDESEAFSATFTATIVVIPHEGQGEILSYADTACYIYEIDGISGKAACEKAQREYLQGGTNLNFLKTDFESKDEVYEYLKQNKFIKN